MHPHYSSSLITRHKATDWASEAFMVMQLFVAPGPGCYEATLGLRAINCSFTDEFVAAASQHEALSCLKGIVTSADMHTQWRQNTRQQCNRQVMSEDGGPVRGSKHVRRKTWEGVRCHTSFSDVHQWIHLQQITPGWNVFFSNSHQWLVTSLRGSAQILQQTEQCSAILGYISPSVLQYASYRPLAPASVHCTPQNGTFSSAPYLGLC